MNRITIKDVAKEAGVSITTVSHVINETRYVDPGTKQRVVDAMDKLGYLPNSIARSLRSGKTKTIGLIVPDASNPFFAEVSRRIEDIGYKQDYSVILCNSDNNPAKQKKYIKTLLEKQVDGMVFIAAGGKPNDLLPFSENKIPVVVADRDVPLELADVVLLDNKKAGYNATKHLIDLGHTRIACISGPLELSPCKQRIEGYKCALDEYGLPFREEYITSGEFNFKSGNSAMSQLLKCSSRPTAVFALNDMMAIGAVYAMNEIGVRVPEDISIVGFDDIELVSIMTPPITTIAQPVDEMAHWIMDLLMNRIHGTRKEGNRRIKLLAKLIIRKSTLHRKEN